MAEIKISIAEIVGAIVANDLMPEQISNIEVQGDTVNFHYKTGLLIPKSVEASLSYIEFDKNIITLEVHTSWFADKLLRVFPIDQSEFFQYDHPNVIFYIQSFLNEKIKGIQIENIKFKNGKFTITTYNQ